MANNLKDHLKEVADAIRAKKGTSDLINPQDFATEIEGISGGGESGGSTIEYLDLTGLATLQVSYFATSSQELHLKMTIQGQEIATVGPAAQLVSQGSSASTIYAKIDFDAPIIMVQGTMRQDSKVRDYILSKVSESELAAIPRITKEQFYDLNA